MLEKIVKSAACAFLIASSNTVAHANDATRKIGPREKISFESQSVLRVAPAERNVARSDAASELNAGPPISYAVISQSLSSLADAFSKITGKTVTVDGASDVPVRNIVLNGSLPAVLKTLNRAQGIVWWSDGARYTLASGAGSAVKRFPLGDLATGEARGLIARTFSSSSDGLVELDEASRAIVVRGPKGASDEMESALKAAKSITTQGITVVRFGKVGN